MVSMPKILVAIPAYNCEKQIPRVLAGFTKELLARVEKVVVIDNGSTDNTVRAAQGAAKKLHSPKVEVWQNKGNYNLGGTHKVAFLAGEKMKADYVAILHGDDQAKTPELNLLIDAAIAHPEKGAILGCRFMPGSTLKGYSWQRIWGNRAINLAYSIVALRHSRDLGSGLNLFRLQDLADHRYLGFGDTITFNIDLLLDYFSKKTPLLFVPITWTEEDQVSNARNFKVGSTAIKKLLRWRVGKSELHPQPAAHYKSGPAA
jgi:dolichol-phosphate mannosyltransferase